MAVGKINAVIIFLPKKLISRKGFYCTESVTKGKVIRAVCFKALLKASVCHAPKTQNGKFSERPPFTDGHLLIRNQQAGKRKTENQKGSRNHNENILFLHRFPS